MQKIVWFHLRPNRLLELFDKNLFFAMSKNSQDLNLCWCDNHRHYVHRLRLTACAAGKICTAVILGLATAESLHLRWGQPLVNPYINLKSIFMTLSPSYIRSLWRQYHLSVSSGY